MHPSSSIKTEAKLLAYWCQFCVMSTGHRERLTSQHLQLITLSKDRKAIWEGIKKKSHSARWWNANCNRKTVHIESINILKNMERKKEIYKKGCMDWINSNRKRKDTVWHSWHHWQCSQALGKLVQIVLPEFELNLRKYIPVSPAREAIAPTRVLDILQA